MFDISKREEDNIEEFFQVLKGLHTDNVYCTCDMMILHPALLCKLRPYQEQAVRWMLHKERLDCNANCRKTSFKALYDWFMLHDMTDESTNYQG